MWLIPPRLAERWWCCHVCGTGVETRHQVPPAVVHRFGGWARGLDEQNSRQGLDVPLVCFPSLVFGFVVTFCIRFLFTRTFEHVSRPRTIVNNCFWHWVNSRSKKQQQLPKTRKQRRQPKTNNNSAPWLRGLLCALQARSIVAAALTVREQPARADATAWLRCSSM